MSSDTGPEKVVMATAMGAGAPRQLAMLMAIGLSAQRAGVQSAKELGRPKSLESSGAEPACAAIWAFDGLSL